MLKVTFEGVEYTKASEVAKEFGYTADYIGQLCRAKKINARLVGRSWFVNVPSLEKHRAQKYQKSEVSQNAEVGNLVTQEVEGAEAAPVEIKKAGTTSKKYLRRVSAPNARFLKITNQQSFSGTKDNPLRYESDDYSLMPKVSSSPKVTLLRVNMAEAESVSVKSSQKKASTLLPEELPDVALSGALKITEIPDGEYSNEEKPKSEPAEEFDKEKSSNRDKLKNKLKIRIAEEVKPEPVKLTVATKKSQEPSIKAEKAVKVKKVRYAPKSVTKMSQIHVPKSQKAGSTEIPVANLNTTPQIVPIQVGAPIAGLALGLVVATLILSAVQVGLVTSQVEEFSLSFDWSNVSNMALVLFTG